MAEDFEAYTVQALKKYVTERGGFLSPKAERKAYYVNLARQLSSPDVAPKVKPERVDRSQHKPPPSQHKDPQSPQVKALFPLEYDHYVPPSPGDVRQPLAPRPSSGFRQQADRDSGSFQQKSHSTKGAFTPKMPQPVDEPQWTPPPPTRLSSDKLPSFRPPRRMDLSLLLYLAVLPVLVLYFLKYLNIVAAVVIGAVVLLRAHFAHKDIRRRMRVSDMVKTALAFGAQCDDFKEESLFRSTCTEDATDEALWPEVVKELIQSGRLRTRPHHKGNRQTEVWYIGSH